MIHKCSILGCGKEFVSNEKAQIHAATSWHCIGCGYSDETELTVKNIATKCNDCTKRCKYICVDFKRRVYTVNEIGKRPVLVAKEYGKWVRYE